MARLMAAGISPCRYECCGDIMLLPVAARHEMGARRSELPALDRLSPEDEVSQIVLRIVNEQPVCESDCIVHIAVCDCCNKSTLDKPGIARVITQRFAEEGGRSHRVAFGPGNKGGKIVSRRTAADLEGRRNCDIIAHPRI